MKKENYRRISHNEFIEYIDRICNDLEKYINENQLKVDYICPILRSGGVPAIYISNRLNIVKFAPFQVKHIKYNNDTYSTEILFNPFNSLEIKKSNPVFLVVEAMHSTGSSVALCINEIKKNYKDAIILYVSVTKAYGYRDFKGEVAYENTGFYYNRCNREYSKEECEQLGIEFYNPLFPWENLELELIHPDDLEDNIFF